MTSQHLISDNLTNLVSGLGTDRDKANGATYAAPKEGQESVYRNAYRGAWLPRRVVDQVAEDAFRKWREWQAEPDQITLIDQMEKRLDVRSKLERAKKMARLFGRAYVYISIKGDVPSEPLEPSRVKRDGIHLLQVLLESEVAEGEIETDALAEGYGKPKYYEVVSGNLTRVHPSRMVIFYGAKKPQDWIYGDDADSVLMSTIPAILRHDSTVANVASLVYESRVDVITIPGLADMLQDPETETALLRRFQLMAQMKGNNGLVMLNGSATPSDPSEEWEQKNATFTTLPDIIEKAQEEVAAAARIPRAILFGTGAGGLGATGDLELSAYYDHINTIQTNEIEPAISILDECLIRSALGNRPPEIWYQWSSLWQMSDQDKAKLANDFAGAFQKLAASGVIPAEVMTQSAVNRFTESGILPGLEQDYNDWIEGGGMDDLPDMPEEEEDEE